MADPMVITPGGYRPKSYVHLIEPGHGLTFDKGVLAKIELATKKITHFPAMPPIKVPRTRFARADAANQSQPQLLEGNIPGNLPAGWQTFAQFDSGGASISFFSTTWTVPPAPATQSGQLIYLFNGLEDLNGQQILQPVSNGARPLPAAATSGRLRVGSSPVTGPRSILYSPT